jgi:hypothetical protein
MPNEDMMYTALRRIAREGDDEIPLSEGLSLVRPNQEFLNRRWDWVSSKSDFENEEEASRYLVCKYPSWSPDYKQESAREFGKKRFYSGLMAIQVIKPVQTLGLIYSHQHYSHKHFEKRPPMDAGKWARLARFDDVMLARVPDMIKRIQHVTNGTKTEPKNALVLLQLGLEHFHPYIAGLLWVMGLEAIFDSENKREFKRKLCDCLGPKTLAFPNWNPKIKGPQYTVEEIAIPLYMLRSKLAHGADLRKAKADKKTPVDLIAKAQLTEHSEPTKYADILSQAACFLLCQVLQKVI